MMKCGGDHVFFARDWDSNCCVTELDYSSLQDLPHVSCATFPATEHQSFILFQQMTMRFLIWKEIFAACLSNKISENHMEMVITGQL